MNILNAYLLILSIGVIIFVLNILLEKIGKFKFNFTYVITLILSCMSVAFCIALIPIYLFKAMEDGTASDYVRMLIIGLSVASLGIIINIFKMAFSYLKKPKIEK